jgi:trans-2,3-dihydro-3-hydroxyanthranilate isomerase
MPFAGHPNVGTAFVLARQGSGGDAFRFEEMAGLVEVRLIREGGDVVGAEIDAPRPLATFQSLDPETVAACLALAREAVRTGRHPPVRASVGVDFILAEVEEGALAAATPDLAAFRRAASASGLEDRLSIFFYCRPASGPLRARMFAPLSGTWEDPATGSANATLAALLLSLGDEGQLAYEAVQGVEMGRPSRLSLRAWRAADGIRASVGGRCVPVLSGFAQL